MNKEARKAYVEEFNASGMKQKQFADSKNISVKSLNKWINEFKNVPRFGKIDFLMDFVEYL